MAGRMCPGCSCEMEQHCARGCEWWACINRGCALRFLDARSGRRVLKVAEAAG